jgi:DNA mismatch repair ATPase MutL
LLPDFTWLIILAIGGLFSYLSKKSNDQNKARREENRKAEEGLNRKETFGSPQTQSRQQSAQTISSRERFPELGADETDMSPYTRSNRQPYERAEETPYSREEETPYAREKETPYKRKRQTPYRSSGNKQKEQRERFRRLTNQDLADGIVLAEILDKPRAKRPHPTAAGYTKK